MIHKAAQEEMLVVGEHGGSERTNRDQLEAVLRHWGPHLRPTPRLIELEALEADASLMRHAVLAWVEPGRMEEGRLFELIARLQDRQVPTLVSFNDPAELDMPGRIYEEGVVAAPVDTPPQVLAGILQALLSQAPVIESLKEEARLLGAQQGGLSGQIDRLNEELRLAAELQREFLPTRLPSMADVSFRVFWRPTGYVSGDIYDVQRLDEHHLGFFLADAVGHGVPAALLTMYIKRSLMTKRIGAHLPDGYEIVPPAQTLAQLNHDLLDRESERVRFTTACYGVIDTRDLSVQVARAGHPFPLVLRGDGTTETVDCEGPLLGVFPDETFEQAELKLNPGDRLVFYTDGFEMVYSEADERLAQSSADYTQQFERLREGTLEEAMRHFAHHVDRQAGSLNQRDDLTLLCMDVAAEAAGLEPAAETRRAMKVPV